jgi:plasmid stability protein
MPALSGVVRAPVRRSGDLRHTLVSAESCCLPALTRFTALRCTGPDRLTGARTSGQHSGGTAVPAERAPTAWNRVRPVPRGRGHRARRSVPTGRRRCGSPPAPHRPGTSARRSGPLIDSTWRQADPITAAHHARQSRMRLHACYHAGMAQLTIRGSDELISRVKSSAADVGRSMNDYVISILDAATNPDLADSASDRLRERLRRAGLLATPARLPGQRPTRKAIAEAGERAAKGRPVSDFVTEGR